MGLFQHVFGGIPMREEIDVIEILQASIWEWIFLLAVATYMTQEWRKCYILFLFRTGKNSGWVKEGIKSGLTFLGIYEVSCLGIVYGLGLLLQLDGQLDWRKAGACLLLDLGEKILMVLVGNLLYVIGSENYVLYILLGLEVVPKVLLQTSIQGTGNGMRNVVWLLPTNWGNYHYLQNAGQNMWLAFAGMVAISFFLYRVSTKLANRLEWR